MKKIIKEFKEFAVKGNVVDMAVGVIIGGAFGKIVTSLVGDIVMPAISALSGDADFTGFKWVIRQAVMDGANVVTPEIAINYGSFIQTIVDFLIIAFVIFGINKLKRKEKEKPAEKPAEPAADIKLLTEIRDLLKK